MHLCLHILEFYVSLSKTLTHTFFVCCSLVFGLLCFALCVCIDGPLTFGQLEYNLPPIATLRDILEVMVIMGVVQVVHDNNNNTTTESVRYCMLHGIPRADVILPQMVVEDILEAQTEVTRSRERCRILKEALLSKNSTKQQHPREVLKQILLDYPEIAHDPMYVAGLRNVHVDVSAVDRERFKQQRILMTTQQQQQQTQTQTTSSNEAITAITATWTNSESVELKMSSQDDSTKEVTTTTVSSSSSSGVTERVNQENRKQIMPPVASVVQDQDKETDEMLVQEETKK